MLRSSNAGNIQFGRRGSWTFNCLEQTEEGHAGTIGVFELDLGMQEGVVDDKSLARARTT